MVVSVSPLREGVKRRSAVNFATVPVVVTSRLIGLDPSAQLTVSRSQVITFLLSYASVNVTLNAAGEFGQHFHACFVKEKSFVISRTD